MRRPSEPPWRYLYGPWSDTLVYHRLDAYNLALRGEIVQARAHGWPVASYLRFTWTLADEHDVVVSALAGATRVYTCAMCALATAPSDCLRCFNVGCYERVYVL